MLKMNLCGTFHPKNAYKNRLNLIIQSIWTWMWIAAYALFSVCLQFFHWHLKKNNNNFTEIYHIYARMQHLLDTLRCIRGAIQVFGYRNTRHPHPCGLVWVAHAQTCVPEAPQINPFHPKPPCGSLRWQQMELSSFWPVLWRPGAWGLCRVSILYIQLVWVQRQSTIFCSCFPSSVPDTCSSCWVL